MPFTPIPAGPPVPNSEDPENTFDEQYEASMTWQRDELAPGVNAAVEEINDAAAAVLVAADAVADDAGTVAAAVLAAQAAAASAINAPGTKGTSATSLTLGLGVKNFTMQTGKDLANGQPMAISRTSAPATQMFGPLLSYDAITGAASVDVTSFKGAGTYTDWTIALGVASLPSTPDLVREPRSSNIAFVQDDKGKLIVYTAGGFTQTFGTLNAGWFVEVVNASAADVGITTDGATYKIYPFERRRLEYDGTNMTSTVLNAYYKVFTASDTWVKPPGYARHAVRAWGAGSGGQVYTDGSSQWLRYGGCGGGCVSFSFQSADLTATVSVTIGAGGAYTTTNTMNAGGNTTFGAYATAYGAPSTASASGGLPAPTTLQFLGTGYRSVNDVRNINSSAAEVGLAAEWGGGQGGRGRSLSGNVQTGASGGASIWGGGGGAASGSVTSPGTGGTSQIGGKGGDATTPVGTAPGGGGYGGTGGNGARGECRTWGEI